MNFKLVFDSQINHSPSKQTYSFSRSKRFTDNPEANSSRFYYRERGALTDRSAVFGKQERSRQYQSRSPAPNMYKINSQFNLESKKGYSFGKSIRNKTQKSPTPGPARYYTQMSTSPYRTQTGYSFGKDQYRSRVRNSDYVVGPGDYLTPLDTLRTTSMLETKYKNAQYGKIGTEERFKKSYRTITPGPGTYASNLSAFPKKSNAGTVFARSSRMQRDDRSISPGPGDYNNFSEFARLNKSTL